MLQVIPNAYAYHHIEHENLIGKWTKSTEQVNVFLQGVLKVNQLIEVRPGITVKDEDGNIKCTPIYSRIVSLFAEQNELQFAVPGGLIGVGTTMDPTLTRADRLVGHVLGEVGSLPDVFTELEVHHLDVTFRYF